MNRSRLTILLLIFFISAFSAFSAVNSDSPPNVILVFIDDMGWADFSCFGNTEVETTNIDRLAAEGLRFENFHVNSPICSPSRVAISTGHYPARWGIASYLADRQLNIDRGMAQWLDPEAPMLARRLKEIGYATGHFGKWHMGGQRDVTDAPPITAYGFDESLTNFEGMGAKLLPLTLKPGDTEPKRIWEPAAILGGPVTWMLRSKITGGFVDVALPFIDRAIAAGQPFYLNLWPDDVHGPLWPPVDEWGNGAPRTLYLAVLKEMDRQLGKLFDRIRNGEELRDNTLLLICSDNGPSLGNGSAGKYRGYKTHLYEGGIRSPLVVWGPGLIPAGKAGTVNTTSLFSSIDLVASVLAITGASVSEGIQLDGEALPDTLLGKSDASRKSPLYFRRPPDRNAFYGVDELPDLAVIDGKWKLLCEYDGSNPELYNLDTDPSETTNLASTHPDQVQRLTRELLAWEQSMPQDKGATFMLKKPENK